ncbi:hypothetical protein FDG95_gp498 [Pectobacterium phage vB_PcaM_CBB]|uniref:Uncharacterized protein n=1 Tax=Pectobacterium phage vB_PcaM_CBB TaxID=2772511 RepID=A0A1L2CVJ8_9CAUD|nr:hypothetical protein FDG95_gp498 [Pectobacterium phage vB_PcaM_CBB]AMM44044.1 hypothetical protein CBB_481 [Pectobacterium phage vB_PcaM_CBB]
MTSTLIICCTIAFCTICLMICNVRKVTAKVYAQVATYDALPKSPYSLIRTKSSSGGIGYSITKNGEIIYIPSTDDKQYEVFGSLSNAIFHINTLEKIEGYRLTQV